MALGTGSLCAACSPLGACFGMETSVCCCRKIHTCSWIPQLSKTWVVREMALKRFYFYWIFLCFHWNRRKEKGSFISPSAQQDTANLKKSQCRDGLSCPAVVSIIKGIKDQFVFTVRKKNSPFCCCHEAEMKKLVRQGCPAVTSAEVAFETHLSHSHNPSSCQHSHGETKEGTRKHSAVLSLCWRCSVLYSVTVGPCLFRPHSRKLWTIFHKKGLYFPQIK